MSKIFLSFCLLVPFELTLFIQGRGRLVIINLKLSSADKCFQEERKTKENGSEIKSCQVQRITCRHYRERTWKTGGWWNRLLKRNKAHNNMTNSQRRYYKMVTEVPSVWRAKIKHDINFSPACFRKAIYITKPARFYKAQLKKWHFTVSKTVSKKIVQSLRYKNYGLWSGSYFSKSFVSKIFLEVVVL